MEIDDLHDMQEDAEHSEGDRSLLPVTFTMAVLAVVLAATTLLGHRSHTEEVLMQSKASDQWAYYQAKGTRRHEDEQFNDLTSLLASPDPAALQQLKHKYSQEADRYRDDQKELDAEARKLEAETATQRKRADRYDLGEVFLEIGLVVTSITLLSGRRIFWKSGIVLGLAGMATAASALLLH